MQTHGQDQSQLENPPSFLTCTEAAKVAWDNGYRLPDSAAEGAEQASGSRAWLRFRSTTAPGGIAIARALDGAWLLRVEHSGVVRELLASPADAPVSDFNPKLAPGLTPDTHFRFSTLHGLYAALDRTYRLSVSLPTVPLAAFERQTASLARETEAERLVVQRVGQNIFRAALMEYWRGTCPLTGITDPALLRASHIVPWAECETDALRLDVHNGLLLSSLWDAAFDAGLVSFTDRGEPIRSPRLSTSAARALQLDQPLAIKGLAAAHRPLLGRHRAKHGLELL